MATRTGNTLRDKKFFINAGGLGSAFGHIITRANSGSKTELASYWSEAAWSSWFYFYLAGNHFGSAI